MAIFIQKPWYRKGGSGGVWVPQEWNVSIDAGDRTWTDGEDIYYSWLGTSYKLNKSTKNWDTITWSDSGYTSIKGTEIFIYDNTHVIYLDDRLRYEFSKPDNAWYLIKWRGGTPDRAWGSRTWTDGENLYLSSNSDQYRMGGIYTSNTYIWETKTWNGLSSFVGQSVWTDGNNIYYSSQSTQKILDVSTSTWSDKIWNGLSSFDGIDVWTDGTDIYYSATYPSNQQYILDKSTSTWSVKNWGNISDIRGRYVWTDGTDIYYSYSTSQYKRA